MKPGTSLVSVPRNSGVWAAWDDFVTSQYVETWIGGLSKAVYEVNSGNPNFKGVVYFGLHNWSLAYEEVTDPNFRVDSLNKWVPFGTQRGVSLSKICSLPYVDQIICETFPPIRSGLYQFVSEYKRISAAHGKLFGLMIHRDDNWGLDGWDSETDRWQMIEAFQPTIVARYPIDRLFPNDKYYNEQKENLFDQRLLAYRPVNPIPPAVLSPAAQARNLPTTLTLSWGSCVGASRYHLQVSKDSIFTQLAANDSTISLTSCQIGPLSNGTTYYWHVRGKTARGASAWSSTCNFTTIFGAPAAPTLTAPADIEGNVSITPILRWAKATGAATYRLQVSVSSVFSTTVLNDSTITDTMKVIGPLQSNTTYYWRVSAKNEVGTSPWSQARRFTTIVAAPQAPTLTSPAESAINVQLNPALNWNPSLGATSYGLQLATTTGFASTVVNDSTITTTSRTVGPLSLATTYYWRVKAKNDGGWSSFSGARQFSTIRTTSVERLGNGIPNQYALSQNYPNPFNPTTIIRFALPTGNQVSLRVFDLLGREAATLVTEELGPGYYSVRWRAEVPSGAYIYRLQAGEFVDTRKMVVVH